MSIQNVALRVQARFGLREMLLSAFAKDFAIFLRIEIEDTNESEN